MARAAALALLVAVLETDVRADEAAGLAALLGTDRACEAAMKLADLGPAAKEAVPQLAHALESSDGELRWRAAWALSRIGPDAVPAAPALAETFGAELGMTQAAARIALIRIGRGATGALIKAMASAPERYVHGKTNRATQPDYLELLLDADPDPEAAVPAVLKLLSNEAARDEAFAVLARMGPRAAAAGPPLAARFRGLGEKESAEAHGLLDTMVALGEPGVAILAELAQASLTDDRRGNVIGALARIPGPGVASAKPCLEATAVRTELAGALRHIAKAGPHAAELVPLLEPRIARWEAPPKSAAALLALGEPGVQALERLLFKADARLRTELAKQLCEEEWEYSKSDPDGRVSCPLVEAHRAVVVPWLLKLGQPKDPADAKKEILRSLARIRLTGADARAAATLAGLQLKSDSTPVAVEACGLAGSLGPAAASLAGRLKSLVKGSDHDAAVVAAAALCEIGKGGPKESDLLGWAIARAIEKDDAPRVRDLTEWLPRAGPPPPARCLEISKILLPRVKPIRSVGVDEWFESNAAARTLAYLLPGLPASERGPVLAALRDESRPASLTVWSLARAGMIESVAELLSPVGDLTDAALEGIAAAPRSPWSALVAHLTHASPEVRRFAARGLLLLDPAKAGEQACLLGLGDDETCRFDAELVAVYRKLDPSPAPALRKGLESGNATTRHRSAVMLGALGSRDAIPVIREAMEQRNLFTRKLALEVLDALLAE